ncbi:MAG: 4Fe-4S dicluster domain-containing protein [Chloroflexi bacterium]|nr:4Fe-4S dicluster domain-containing protein [Chloroflexota bacterium]
MGETPHAERMARSILIDTLAQALNDASILAGAPLQTPLADAVTEGAQHLGSAACRRALFALKELPSVAADELQRRFDQVISRPGRRPVPLYESLALNGRLLSPTTHDVARQYRQYGLEPDGDLADSAPVELAFLAFLVEAEAEALLMDQQRQARRWRKIQRQFLNEHVITWLPMVGRALAQSDDPHFVMLGHLLEGFLKEEQLRVLVNIKHRAQADVPSIDAAACGLCGFCVQSCPTGALWVSENDSSTYLVLKPENCIGCAKCLPVCPDDALRMVSRPAGLAPTVILRESPRTHCPRCHTPTVSQAELNAVFARLEADDELCYRLSLCESCKARS